MLIDKINKKKNTHVDGVTLPAAHSDHSGYRLHGHLSHLEH